MQNRVLAGRYRLTSQLGQGGMGSVWRAEHVELGTPLAVKLMDSAILSHPEGVLRFKREAKAAAGLRSPHVVQVFDYGVEGDTPFLAMELLEGESLARRIERLGRLPPEETARILGEVARAITKAHQARIVHRDLKPDNIFLVHDDEREIAKVLDFGIAKHMSVETGSTPSTQAGAVLGTPHYMSPEQARGDRSIDHRTDIWAFGVIAFECLTGQRAFEGEALGALVIAICTGELPVPSRIAPVPPGFDAWFARAAARDPADRFASIQEAAASLRDLCGGPQLPAPSTPLAHARPAPGRTVAMSNGTPEAAAASITTGAERSKTLRSVALVVVACVVLAGIVVAYGSLRDAESDPSAQASSTPIDAPNLPSAPSAPLVVPVAPPAAPAGGEAPVEPASSATSTPPIAKAPAAPAVPGAPSKVPSAPRSRAASRPKTVEKATPKPASAPAAAATPKKRVDLAF